MPRPERMLLCDSQVSVRLAWWDSHALLSEQGQTQPSRAWRRLESPASKSSWGVGGVKSGLGPGQTSLFGFFKTPAPAADQERPRAVNTPTTGDFIAM